MHVLIVAESFPSPAHPYRGTFIGEQVKRLLDHVERITVLSPTTYVPRFLKVHRVARQASLPARYEFVKDRCEVLFPRCLKAPSDMCLWWTTAQWRRIVSNTVGDLLKTGSLSLIHANKGGVGSWAAIQTARQYGLPCVVTYQGTEVHTDLVNRKNAWKLCRDSFRFADLNIVVSRSLERTLKACIEPQGRCEVLIRGVDLETFFPPKEEGTKQPVVLFVGAVRATKGAFDLLAAWTQVVAKPTHADLWVVGPDYTNGRFAREVQSRGHHKSVKILGPQPLSNVANLMRQAQVFCLPSHGEGTPNCVMEAMACGLPIVATDVGGIPDIVETDRTGILIPRGDTQNLAEALASLLQDSGRRARMGKAAYEFACQHLDSRRTTNRLVELYHDLLVAPGAKAKA
ncbi:MAG: glycosyltransferase family 4 protein [Nitrospira sp.]|nr:glycosyltransferase family 4 protein [Nitrospira sp.]